MKSRLVHFAIALLLMTGLTFNPQTLIASAITAPDVSSSSLLAATNDQRAQNGLSPLYFNYQLTNAAQAKANDMVANDYWAHVSPSGMQPWDFVSQSGYDYWAAGENLASGFGSLSEVIVGWMNSPTHRANLLSTRYSEVGFGVANATNFQGTGAQTIVVAEYGAPMTAPAPEPVYTAPEPAPTPVAAEPVAEPVVEPTVVTEPTPVEPVVAPTPATTGKTTAPSSPANNSLNNIKTNRQLDDQTNAALTTTATPWVAYAVIAFGLLSPGLYAYRKKVSFDQPSSNPMSYIVY